MKNKTIDAILLVVTIVAVIIILILVYQTKAKPFKAFKVGGATITDQSQLQQVKNQLQAKLDDSSSTMASLIANADPSNLSSDDITNYVKAQLEQQQAQLQQQQIAEQEQAQNQQDQQTALIEEVKTSGYSGEGTKEDYEKLFNHPELYGANWQRNADSQYDSATDKLATFLKLYSQMK